MEKSILITGCSSGIGLCASHTLKKRGYRVFATARKSEDITKLQNQGFESYRLDLADSTSIKQTVENVLAVTGGTLFALINNGGYAQAGAVEDLGREAMRMQFETNVFGTQDLTNLIIPVMRRQGYGRLLYISSVLGLVALPYRGLYCASKFAIEALGDALRLELRHSPLRVSIIEPGPIASHFREAAFAAYAKGINIERSAHYEDYQKFIKNFERTKKTMPFTWPPEVVVKKIINALESKHPKAHYYATPPTFLLSFLRRLLPTSLLDKFVVYISNKELD